MSRLNYLVLIGNQLEEIPDFIYRVEGLHTLAFSYNPKITELLENINKLYDLMRLHLAGTSIQQLPKSLANTLLTNIEYEQSIIMPHNFTKIKMP